MNEGENGLTEILGCLLESAIRSQQGLYRLSIMAIVAKQYN